MIAEAGVECGATMQQELKGVESNVLAEGACRDEDSVGLMVEADYIPLEAFDHFLGSFSVPSEVVLLYLLGGNASCIDLRPRIHWSNSHDSRK